MVTKATLPEKEDQPTQVERAVRSAIAGHPQGAIRRIVLYLVTYVAVLVSAFAGTLAPIALSVALGSLLLLVSTDQLL